MIYMMMMMASGGDRRRESGALHMHGPAGFLLPSTDCRQTKLYWTVIFKPQEMQFKN